MTAPRITEQRLPIIQAKSVELTEPEPLPAPPQVGYPAYLQGALDAIHSELRDHQRTNRELREEIHAFGDRSRTSHSEMLAKIDELISAMKTLSIVIAAKTKRRGP